MEQPSSPTYIPGSEPSESRIQRFVRFPLIRMVVAIFMTALAGGSR